MKLARVLGFARVDDLLDQLSPGDLNEWIASDRLDPFGDDWLRSATVASTVANEITSIRYMLAKADVPEDRYLSPGDLVPGVETLEKLKEREEPDLSRVAEQHRAALGL